MSYDPLRAVIAERDVRIETLRVGDRVERHIENCCCTTRLMWWPCWREARP